MSNLPDGITCGTSAVTDAGTWCLACLAEDGNTVTSFGGDGVSCTCSVTGKPCLVYLNGEETTEEAYQEAISS